MQVHGILQIDRVCCEVCLFMNKFTLFLITKFTRRNPTDAPLLDKSNERLHLMKMDHTDETEIQKAAANLQRFLEMKNKNGLSRRLGVLVNTTGMLHGHLNSTATPTYTGKKSTGDDIRKEIYYPERCLNDLDPDWMLVRARARIFPKHGVH